MLDVEDEIDRVFAALRAKLEASGRTQTSIQEELGWGRGSISELLAKRKDLRMEHITLMLQAIGKDPAEFWADLYPSRNEPPADDEHTGGSGS